MTPLQSLTLHVILQKYTIRHIIPMTTFKLKFISSAYCSGYILTEAGYSHAL